MLTALGKELSVEEKEIAYLRQPSKDVPKTNTQFQEFPSRQEAFQKLWEQLESEDVLILGIHGMPGVGKTRMMQQIWEKAQSQEKRIFDKVTLAVVGSVAYDVIKLQDELARGLDCDLKSKDDKENRAEQLKKSMLNSGKILVIFDDVWGEVSVTDIMGTSFDDGNNWKGCKILFTSRQISDCQINNCNKPVKITELNEEEAWDMFKKSIIGTDQVDFPPDELVMKKVCKKCGGLPLVIHAVGKALRFKSKFSWQHALRKLEDCEIENIPGIEPRVYACLKLSFDNLPEDAKHCLLLCSLFFADEIIDIRTLIHLATGSQLVKDGRKRVSAEDKRVSVCAMVETLKSYSLLLREGEDNQKFKLHDTIRDVARSIAVKDYGFVTEKCDPGLHGSSADNYAAGKVLHLELAEDDFHFPPDLVCEDLHTLWLRSANEVRVKMNIEFSGGMFPNLRCLVLFKSSSLQLSIQSLDKLKILLLRDCDIEDTDVSCFPESLETLCIWNCYLPTQLNFQKLTNLRELDISGINRSQMVLHTISGLSRLEELRLQEESHRWKDYTNTIMPPFNEISKLTFLKSLKIVWNDFDPSQDTSILHNSDSLLNYDIRVGVGVEKKYKQKSHASSTRLIELFGETQFECFQGLVERAEEVTLQKTNVKTSTIWERNREAFKDLKSLYILHCDTVEYVARIPYDEIQPSLPQNSSFSKLTVLEVSDCSGVKYLFNNTVAERLVQLRKLNISDCDAMEVVVLIEGPSDFVRIPQDEIQQSLPQHASLSKLTTLKVSSCSALKYLFNNTVAERLVQLQKLRISDCEAMEVVVLNEGPGDVISFSNLKLLEMSELYKLKSFRGEGKNMHSRSTSAIENSDQSRSLFDGTVTFPSLEILRIDELYNINDIWGKSYSDDSNNSPIGIIVFSKLMELKVGDLRNLTCFYSHQSEQVNKVAFPNLERFIIDNQDINLEWIEFGSDDSPWNLKYMRIRYDEEKQLPPSTCTWELLVHNLETLILQHCLSDVLRRSRCIFRRLKELEVSRVECSTLFSLSVIRGLQQLRELEISDCTLLEEFVEDVRGNKNTITLSHLRWVRLDNLPALKSFMFGANYELHMPNLSEMDIRNCGVSSLFTSSVFHKLQQLKDLDVRGCNMLEAIVVDERGIDISDADDKIITLSRLFNVTLVNLPNLKSFIHSANHDIHMPALFSVRVESCGLSTLFTYSGLQKSQQLCHLHVSNCDRMETIVADERGIKTSDISVKVITLPNLSSVVLRNLPNLTRFSLTVNYAFNMPQLRRFNLEGYEYSGSLNTSTDERVLDVIDYIKQQGKRLDSESERLDSESESERLRQ